MDGRIFQLHKRILVRLDHQWTIDEMADYTELSIPHFQKLFKTQTGTPPMNYLCELRLEKARQLLEDSHHRINQIGIAVGMLNDSHFTRDFKKKFGITPTEYRRRYWDKIQAEESDGQE